MQPLWMCFPQQDPGAQPQEPSLLWWEQQLIPGRAEPRQQELLCCPGQRLLGKPVWKSGSGDLTELQGMVGSVLQSTPGSQDLFSCTNAIPCP